MELSQLRYFTAVAQLGNMSKAAETMFVSQPNLSTSLSRLEEEVGVPLFERRRGKITLNQSGECFLHYVEQSLAALEKGIQEVRNRNTGRSEPLSIACMVDDTLLLQQFLLKNPDISLNHQRGDLPSVTKMLERQEVDLALTVLEPPGEELAFERIYESEFVLLLNRAHPLAQCESISRRQLAGEHLAIDGSRVNRNTFCATEGKMGTTPIIDYDVRHLELLLSLVEANRCISIVPAVKYHELRLQGKHSDVVCRPYADGAPVAYFGIAYHKRRPLNAQGKRFRDFARSYLQGIDRAYAALMEQVRSELSQETAAAPSPSPEQLEA